MRWSADINAAGASTRLTSSSVGDDGNVTTSPAVLLERARRVVGELSLDEYTLARIIASELGSGTDGELLAIADADVNKAKAKGVSVYQHATAGHDLYGRQGDPNTRPRPVATSQDPKVRHQRVARLVLSGRARGFSNGARRYFDPKTQLWLWERGRAHHPTTILNRWTFNREWVGSVTKDDKGRWSRALGPPRPGGEEWVGPLDDVDAWELMLFRPQTGRQLELFREAQEVIDTRGADQQLAGDIGARLALAVGGMAATLAVKAMWL